jgi:hypothetical protein
LAVENPIGNRHAVLVIKFIEPIFGFFVVAIAMSMSLRLLWIIWPGFLLACFLLTAAQIRPERDCLRYRRFRKWRDLPYREVLKCEVGTFPGLGFLKLRNFLPPWGKLYFVIETHDGWPPRGERLALYINERALGKVVSREPPDLTPQPRTTRQDRLRCFGALVVGLPIGAVSAFTATFAIRGSARIPVVAVLSQMAEWPWNVAIGTLLLVAVLALRFRNNAWVFALGAGSVIGSAVTRVFL